MRPTTEKKFAFEVLKGKDAAEAASELLTNGTQLNNRDKEELESKLLCNLYLCMKYRLDYRKGPWPEFEGSHEEHKQKILAAISKKNHNKLNQYLIFEYVTKYIKPKNQP